MLNIVLFRHFLQVGFSWNLIILQCFNSFSTWWPPSLWSNMALIEIRINIYCSCLSFWYLVSPHACRLAKSCKLEISWSLLWTNWKKKHLNVDVWKRGYVFVKCIVCESLKNLISKARKKTLVWRNIKLNWKSITFTQNVVDIYITLGELKLCNLKNISYV